MKTILYFNYYDSGPVSTKLIFLTYTKRETDIPGMYGLVDTGFLLTGQRTQDTGCHLSEKSDGGQNGHTGRKTLYMCN